MSGERKDIFPAPVADREEAIMFSLVEISVFSSHWCKTDDFSAQKNRGTIYNLYLLLIYTEAGTLSIETQGFLISVTQ